MSGENEENDEQKDPRVVFLDMLVSMAVAEGSTVLEYMVCEHCHEKSLVGHFWSETVACQHCQKHTKSSVPRRPMPGEVTLEHVNTAIQTLIGCYSNNPSSRFSSESKWAELPDETKLLIVQNITAASVAVLKQVDSLAVALATSGVQT